MKIFFNHIDPNRFHSAYQELIKNPPKNYVFFKKTSNSSNTVSFKIGKKIVNTLNLPTLNFILVKRYDLIHSTQTIPITKKRFVLDFEHVSAFGGGNYNRTNSLWFKFFLRICLESPRCKKILPWTNAAKMSLLNLVPSKKIEEKCEVVYPAIPAHKITKKKHKNAVFLFVAYNFYRKGGPELVNAFLKLKKEMPGVILNVICKEEPEFKKCKGINFLGLKSREEVLEKYYPEADVFVYPTFHDTFGMVYLEAMSFGIPVITLDDFPSEEIIEDGKDGFVVKGYKMKWFDEKYLSRPSCNNWEVAASLRTEEEKKEVSQKLYEKMKLLARNKKLREEMGKHAYNKILKGKFSIEHRNKQLLRIYSEAIASK
jgi:glycosyltransferase involved in cell wall biosynthesis